MPKLEGAYPGRMALTVMLRLPSVIAICCVSEFAADLEVLYDHRPTPAVLRPVPSVLRSRPATEEMFTTRPGSRGVASF